MRKPIRTLYRETFSVPVILSGKRIDLEVYFDKHSSRREPRDMEEVRFILDRTERVYRYENGVFYADDILAPEIREAFLKHLPDYVLKHLPC